MNETKYLTTGSLAAIKVRNHKFLSYGTTVLIKKMHGNTITVVPVWDEKVDHKRAAVKRDSDKSFVNYGITSLLSDMRARGVTKVVEDKDKAYFVDANILHNNLMPYF
jgi:hypothetical protein